ncbi:MAG TPA: hypothetical protein VM686_36330 [Polyangiaceae bacterium]|nr:hypothetical protein [Polyangiaceae bacterium]
MTKEQVRLFDPSAGHPPPSDGPLPFVDIVSVDSQHVAAAVWLSRCFVPAIRENLDLDVAKALEIIRQDNRLKYVYGDDITVEKPNAQVRALVDYHVSGLPLALLTEGHLRDQVLAAVTSTFTNLATQQTSSWLFFQTETAHSTTYLYNIFFAVQNTQTEGAMMGLLLSWIITVDVKKERLLGITLNDTQSYAVRLKSLRVAMKL